MTTDKTTVTMRMQVTIEFNVDRWDQGGMKFADIRETARREGENILKNKMDGTGMQIVGKPIIRAIMVEG